MPGIRRFAAIDVGSYEIEMKIYEISQKYGIREIDDIRHVMELGRDTYAHGSISFELIEELCDVLYRFNGIMKEYEVQDYRANATSAIREAKNAHIILDRIKVRTGMDVKILSNSEQRFLCYKAIASKENDFNRIIRKPTAIVDVGSGSIQLSLFDKDALITTQNIRLGSLRIREMLPSVNVDSLHMELLIEELINNDLQTFRKLFLQKKEIENIIAVGDYVVYFANMAKKTSDKDYLTRDQFMELYDSIHGHTPEQFARKMSIPAENASLILPCLMVYKKLIETTSTSLIWIPGVTLCDGIAAAYAEKHVKLSFAHDFSKDIVIASRNIAKRYMGNIGHTELMEECALGIFDIMKKYHGLGKRDRVLLQIAVILHDCGKYVSMNQPADASYNIIMSTEIIGLSHAERETVANIVRYNTREFDYSARADKSMTSGMYLTVAKLTAILRIANAMDRSHKQKFHDFKMVLKDDELVITAETLEDISLEKALFRQKADFFEEMYGIRPVLKRKKEY